MKNPERMRYQKNTLSYLACLVTIVLDIVSLGLLLGYPPVLTPSPKTGLDVIVHILFLMIAFLAAEKMKVYNPIWAYVAVGLGVFQAIKIPLFLVPYNSEGLMPAGVFYGNIAILCAITLCLFSAAAVCIVRARRLKGLMGER